jgi:hypothetical protein
MASDDCAVGPNGKLFNTLQIVLYMDPDNDEPMALAATFSIAQCQISAPTLNSFITKGPPATCCSTHTPCPSTKVINPDNIVALKHKPSHIATSKPSSHPRHAFLDHEPDYKEDKATEPDLINSEDDNPVNPITAYEETKALGDVDYKVNVHCSSLIPLTYWTLAKAIHINSNVKHTTDISTIFIRARDYIHLDKGKADGHFCLVCRFVFFLKSNAVHNILPRDKGVRQGAYFFSGGTSTLYTHITRYEHFISSNAMSSLTLSRHKNHFDIYKERCTKLDIPIHNQAIPASRITL